MVDALRRRMASTASLRSPRVEPAAHETHEVFAAETRAAPHAKPPKRRAWLRILRWALVVACAALAVFFVLRARQRSAATPVHYRTALVDRGPIAAKVTASGTLSALVTVTVGSQVSGTINALYADFNSVVKKGDVIATIEPSLFRAAVEQARANTEAARANVAKAKAQLVQAERDFARTRSLLNEGLASKADDDAATANLDVARSQIDATRAATSQALAAQHQAELNLRYTTIVSPIDGVVISRNVDVGQTVAAALQAPVLFTIAQDLKKMQVDTSVAEGDVGHVSQGMHVTFTVDAYGDRKFEGTVRQVRDNATTVQNVVTYDAVIDVDNEDLTLRPGMTANATFVYATRDDAVRLPNAALRFKPDAATLTAMNVEVEKTSGDERTVFVLREGRAVAERVHIGIGDGFATEIVSGDVHPDDAAITEATVDVDTKKVF